MQNKIYLNFGAGNPVKKWINFDSSPFFKTPQIIHRLLVKLGISRRSKLFIDNNYTYFKFSVHTPLPFKSESVAAIHTSHVLEHLSDIENDHFFSESRRILTKGGVLRVIVPDLEKNMQLKSIMFSLEKELLTLPVELKQNKIRAMLEALHGFPSFHKTIFVSKFITKHFSSNWRVKNNLKFLESNINKTILKLVESKQRTQNALIFELIKK